MKRTSLFVTTAFLAGLGIGLFARSAAGSPDYLARVRSPENGYMSVPFAEDVELSMRIS